MAIGPLDLLAYLFEHKAQQAEAMKAAKQVILDVSKEFYDMFQVVIQLGAIIAVVILFWKQIWPVKKEKEKLTLD